MNAASLIQAGLAVFGLASLAMALDTSARARRWAPIVGLCGQPFWLAFALDAKAWGLIATIFMFTIVYVFGIWKQWMPQLPSDEAHAATLSPTAAEAHEKLQRLVLLAAEIADIASVHEIASQCPFVDLDQVTWYDVARAGEGMVDVGGDDLQGDEAVVAGVQRAVEYLHARRVLTHHPIEPDLVRLYPLAVTNLTS